MHHLGVPTTRALSLVGTGERWCATCSTTAIQRRAGAIVCRVAPSFLRFGNFELPYSRGDLRCCGSWSILHPRDFPKLSQAKGEALYAHGSRRSASAPR
jgi:uncharacterized protein YdiU (UPF0061 family)